MGFARKDVEATKKMESQWYRETHRFSCSAYEWSLYS